MMPTKPQSSGKMTTQPMNTTRQSSRLAEKQDSSARPDGNHDDNVARVARYMTAEGAPATAAKPPIIPPPPGFHSVCFKIACDDQTHLYYTMLKLQSNLADPRLNKPSHRDLGNDESNIRILDYLKNRLDHQIAHFTERLAKLPLQKVAAARAHIAELKRKRHCLETALLAYTAGRLNGPTGYDALFAAIVKETMIETMRIQQPGRFPTPSPTTKSTQKPASTRSLPPAQTTKMKKTGNRPGARDNCMSTSRSRRS
jgi:hypothetical protein